MPVKTAAASIQATLEILKSKAERADELGCDASTLEKFASDFEDEVYGLEDEISDKEAEGEDEDEDEEDEDEEEDLGPQKA